MWQNGLLPSFPGHRDWVGTPQKFNTSLLFLSNRSTLVWFLSQFWFETVLVTFWWVLYKQSNDNEAKRETDTLSPVLLTLDSWVLFSATGPIFTFQTIYLNHHFTLIANMQKKPPDKGPSIWTTIMKRHWMFLAVQLFVPRLHSVTLTVHFTRRMWTVLQYTSNLWTEESSAIEQRSDTERQRLAHRNHTRMPCVLCRRYQVSESLHITSARNYLGCLITLQAEELFVHEVFMVTLFFSSSSVISHWVWET